MSKFFKVIFVLMFICMTFAPYTTHAAGEIIMTTTDFLSASDNQSPTAGQVYQDSLPQQLTVSGQITQVFSQLVVRIFYPSGDLYYVDVIEPDSGAFEAIITLPANTPVGTYEVTVGDSGFQAVSSFSVLTRSSVGGGSTSIESTPSSSTCAEDVAKGISKSIACKEVLVDIPDGSSDNPFTVTIEKLTEQPDRTNFPSVVDCNDKFAVLSVYRLSKSEAGQFKKPVKVSFTFDKALAENRKLSLFYYNEKEDVWMQLSSEIKEGTISAYVENFYKFAVVSVEHIPSFPDIEGHWGEKTIEQAVCLGLIKGYPDGELKPDHSITRAEFSAILKRALKLTNTGKPLVFEDSSAIPAWVRQDIEQLLETNLVKGFDDGTFRPSWEITRSEIATIIARSMDLQPKVDSPTSFVDDQLIPLWAKGMVVAVAEKDIVRGRDYNKFEPYAKTTRAETLVLIMRMLEAKNS